MRAIKIVMLLCMFVSLCLVLLGCSGNDNGMSFQDGDGINDGTNQSEYTFVIREWNFDTDPPAKPFLGEDLPTLTNGRQFDLWAKKKGSSDQPEKLLMKDIQFYKSFFNSTTNQVEFIPFNNVIQWDDVTTDIVRFYRIDEQDMSQTYCVKGCVKTPSCWKSASLEFKVWCIGQQL